ncbi:MAG TPA: hypothetical protein VKV79_04775 [Terriglobia bacterium]|nr:hypothetical protein [Terriglobia bacterium]
MVELAQILVRVHSGTIQGIYLSAEAERDMKGNLVEEEKSAQAEGAAGSTNIDIVGVRDLTELLGRLWPELGVGSSGQQ